MEEATQIFVAKTPVLAPESLKALRTFQSGVPT